MLDEEGVSEADNRLWHGHTNGGRVSTTRRHYIHLDVERRLRVAGVAPKQLRAPILLSEIGP